MGFAIFLAICSAGLVVLALMSLNHYQSGWAAVFVIGAFLMGKWAWEQSRPEYLAEQDAKEKARVEAQKAQDLRDRTPHVIREADGCKVYQFKLGDKWPIYTRCPGSTTVTDRPYEVCKTEGSGKMAHTVCTKHVESIETVTR